MKDINKRYQFSFRQKQFVYDVQRIQNLWGGLATQSEIAERSGVSQATLSRIINGSIPKIPDFLALCGLMQYSPAEYFERDEPSMQEWEK